MTKRKSAYILGVIPRYAALSLLAAVAWNTVVYNGAIWLMRDAPKIDLTSGFEELIPLRTGWIVVYFGCYLFWGVHYILIARTGKEKWFRFLTADLLAELVCGACFLLLPATNVRPEVAGNGVCDQLVRLLYQIDPAQNLFPSIHCVVSWFCYIGLREEKEKFPLWYRLAVAAFAVAVCVSTLFLKQHVLADVLAGVLLAELCYGLCRRTELYRPLMKLFCRE